MSDEPLNSASAIVASMIAVRQAAYYTANKEKITVQQAAYYKANKEKIAIRRAAYSAANKEKIAAYNVIWNAAIRYEAMVAYGGPICVCCGETEYEFLTFDHIHGGGSKQRKEIRGDLARWLRNNNYPNGFQIMHVDSVIAVLMR